MIRLHTEKGEISISDAALSNITGAAATSCFGVKGMAFRSMTDGLVHLLRREAMIAPLSIRFAIWSAKTPARASAVSTFALTA